MDLQVAEILPGGYLSIMSVRSCFNVVSCSIILIWSDVSTCAYLFVAAIPRKTDLAFDPQMLLFLSSRFDSHVNTKFPLVAFLVSVCFFSTQVCQEFQDRDEALGIACG